MQNILQKPQAAMNQINWEGMARKWAFFALLAALLLISTVADAGTGGEAFKFIYDFVNEAATGYLGRSICIIGGIIGLVYAALAGKMILAGSGILLAIFGILGPQIIDFLFQSALI
ncbi:hypothetical protein [uncultured Microbulbifer sp.]|uniref:hypothetical protein n=1 Tax=uncultured Microbulbifer sp. TaxID=348147 RepID=UPI00261F01F5|nr:hypothetical protein [uncultured Microbulbifer sp.]